MGKQLKIKFMNKDGTSTHQGVKLRGGRWLPPVVGGLELCRNGYHYAEEDNCALWIDHTAWLVDVRGDILVGDYKSCAREMRLVRKFKTWNERTQRLFACDCAERALDRCGEKVDPRSLHAIDVARRFARGDASDAARAAARAAARGAAWGAAWGAEIQWQSRLLVRYLKGEIDE